MQPLPTHGSEIELHYPVHTSVKDIQTSNLQPRRIIVNRIRDLVSEPLTLTEFARRPYVSRSRWLIRGWDIDRQHWRNFYLGSSIQYRSPGTLRLAVYTPGNLRPDRILTRGYAPTIKDRRIMLRTIQLMLSREDQATTSGMRIIADDLKITG